LLDMQEDAATHWNKPLTLKRLCGWHAALFPTGYSGLHPVAAGKLRSSPEAMQIVSGPMHNPKVHYVAPPAQQVPAELGRFLKWFNGASRSQDGLLRAGLAHLWFEIIHPFEDGNGRVGRAIVDLALAQDLKGHPRIYSLAAELAGARTRYYEELQQASREGADIDRWLAWFCQAFVKASLRSKSVVLSALAKARFWADHGGTPVTEAQAKVLNRLLDAGPRGFEGDLTTRKYVALTGRSRATAYRDLAAMAAAGLLAWRGQGKATRYFINLQGWEPPP
jgi:Fic family protein